MSSACRGHEGRRKRRKGKVVWREGRGRDEKVRPVAQKDLVEEMVVAISYGKKKRMLAEEIGKLVVAALDVGAVFFCNIGFSFPPFQTMKSTPIYRRWKRDMLSLMIPNLGP
jgi:hypothetical protein